MWEKCKDRRSDPWENRDLLSVFHMYACLCGRTSEVQVMERISILVLHGAQVTHKFCRSIVVYYFSTLISHLDIYEDRAMFSDF